MTSGQGTLEIDVLGPLRVRAGNEVAVSRPAQRRLLSILTMESGRRISTELLIDRFWESDPPRTAKAALQTHLSSLRKVVGDENIVTEAYGYRLAVADDAVDAGRFTRYASDARDAVHSREWDRASELVEKALRLWRGLPYVELRYDEFAQPEISRLEELCVEFQELRAECLINLGRHDEALPDLEALVVAHPYRERLWAHLMVARYRAGRHAEALQAYGQLEEQLAEIGAEPSRELKKLEERILLHDERVQHTTGNLPRALDEFVGRQSEVARLTDLLSSTRLLTLSGPGGSGKTRLAMEVASGVKNRYPDGVWFVDLAPIADPDEIPSHLAKTLGIRADTVDVLKSVIDRLEDSQALIILDNCEHLGDGPSSVAESILRSTSGVTMLATSRSRLRSTPEQVYEVRGLATDPHGDNTFSDAFQLFVTRAEMSGTAIDLATHGGSIHDICRRLEGMPLAIELAAARTRSLAPPVIAERLEDRLKLLGEGRPTGPARHQTLEATLDWSYQLLDDAARRLIRRLSMFRGGFTLDMAEFMGAEVEPPIDDVMTVLTGLVDKSLVLRDDQHTESRFRLLESTIQFAESRMTDEEQLAAHRAHRKWAARFARQWHARYLNGEVETAFRRLNVESDNIQKALMHQAEGQEVDEAHLHAVLAAHYSDVGLVSRALETLEKAFEIGIDRPAEYFWRARLSSLLFDLSRTKEAMDHLRRARQDVLSDAPSAEGAFALQAFARSAALIVEEDPGDAIETAEQAVETARAAGADYMWVRAHRELGFAHAWNGDSRRGLDITYRGLELAKELLDQGPDLHIYAGLFDVIYLDAEARRTDPIRIAREMEQHFGDLYSMGLAANWLPWVYAQAGEFDAAEHAVDLISQSRQEGFWRVWQVITRTTIDWMLGRLEQAAAGVRTLDALDPNPRWYHDYFPLKAEVHADVGNLDIVRSAAEEYVAFGVHSTEEAKKLGALHPLVRAEADAFLASRTEIHRRAARATVRQMHEILSNHPPSGDGSVAMETPSTHLVFAEAELTRVSGSDPDLWRLSVEKADYVYYRLYAQWRLGEALVGRGDLGAGRRVLEEALAESQNVGTRMLTRRMSTTLESTRATS